MADVTYSGDFSPKYLRDGVLVNSLEDNISLNVLGADLFGLGADAMNAFGGISTNSGNAGNNGFNFDAVNIADRGNSFATDIAQSRYFTVTVSEIRDRNGDTITFHTGGAFHDFLPVKNMSLSYTNYENLSVPLACLGGVPLLNKKRLSVIRISCYDTDDDIVEKAVQRWEMRCFPEGKYVAFLEDVAAEFQYKSYDVKGNLVFVKTLTVIPTDDVSVSRGYEENSEKLVTFSLAAVGEPGASANLNAYKGFNDTFEAAPQPAGRETNVATNTTKSSYDQGIALQPLDYPPLESSEYGSNSLVRQAIDDRVNNRPTYNGVSEGINDNINGQ